MLHFKSIRTKLIFGCVILSIIPIALITTVLYNISTKIINENISEALLLNLNSYTDKIDDIFLDIYYETVQLTFDANIRKMINEKDYSSLSNYLSNHFRNDNYVDSTYIYLPENKKLITSNTNVQSIDIDNITDIDEPFTETKGNYPIDVIERYDKIVDKNYFTIKKPLHDSRTNKLIGYMLVNVDEKTIYYDLLNQMAKKNKGKIIMINTDKIIVSSVKQNEIGTRVDNEKDIDFIITSKGYEEEIISGEKFLKVYSVSRVTKHKLIYYIKQSLIIQDINKVTYLSIISIVIVAILIIILWYFYTNDIYKPIKMLKDEMLQVGEGNFDIHIDYDRTDELGILIKGFNEMISKVNYLFNEVYKSQYQRKESELRALQSQITPHFLYNTLNSIRCIAIIQENTTISKMLAALIELLRATAGNKNTFITLNQEIDQVNNYVELQKFRYNDAFNINYEIPSSLLNVKVPKLIIQPLVENSIQHGLDLRNPNGKISIIALKENNDLVIKVIDNGRGITEEEIKRIYMNEEDKSKKFSGIGVYNVDERIKLYYGENYGLYYRALGERGTEAKIIIPINNREA